MFLYYANEGTDDVIDGSTKTVQHSINNISRNIGAVFFKLGTRNAHHKRKRMTSYNTLGPSLISISNPLKWGTGSYHKYTRFPYCLISPN